MEYNGRTFSRTYPNLMAEMTRVSMEYVKSIRDFKAGGAAGRTAAAGLAGLSGTADVVGLAGATATDVVGTAAATATGVVGTAEATTTSVIGTAESRGQIEAPSRLLEITLNPNGFPKLPNNVTGDLTKKDCESLLRRYLSRRYGTSLQLTFWWVFELKW